MEKAIIGAGGFAREVQAAMGFDCKFFVDDEYMKVESGIYGLSQFDPEKYKVVVAIGDPTDRANMIAKLPSNTQYFTFIDPTSIIMGGVDIKIGEGSIICAGCIITTNVQLGEHTHLNLLSTIGHDTIIGDYFTTAPGTKISGNNIIGSRVYIGTNASTKQKLNICDDVTIGMNAAVVKDIVEPGVYVGIPAKKIK